MGNILLAQEGYPMDIHQTFRMCSENIPDFQSTIWGGDIPQKMDIPRNIPLYLVRMKQKLLQIQNEYPSG